MNKTLRRAWPLLLLFFLLLTRPLAGLAEDFVVSTDKGEVRGRELNGVAVYRGIPFAEPPLGDLRFAPPKEAKPWTGVLDCREFRPGSMQEHAPEDKYPYSEDSLYLNIWSPKNTAPGKLPVLVFIHGGAYFMGTPFSKTFDGTSFARDGVIQVNIAYRLDALGFWASEEQKRESGYLGNMGVLDQIMALRWVKNNIAAFGGNPDNITISGESAGSFSVSNLLLSPLSRGLFKRAIMESGTLFGQYMTAPMAGVDPQKTLEHHRAFMTFLGVKDLAEMRRLSAEKIVGAALFNLDLTQASPFYFFPLFDGKILPANPAAALREGKFNDADILLGYNFDDGSMFVPANTDEATYKAYVRRIFGQNGDAALKRFPVTPEHSAAARAREITTQMFRVGGDLFADAYSRKGHKVFFYRFDYRPYGAANADLGARHGLEMPFVFDNLSKDLHSPAAEALRDDIHARWLNFIKNGDPNSGLAVSPKWPQYTEQQRNILLLDRKPVAEVISDYDELTFFRSLLLGKGN